MRVCLINPRSHYLENDAAYPPMGLMYLAASFEKYGAEVCLLDLTKHENVFNRMIYNNLFDEFDLIGFTCVTPNTDEVNRLIKLLPDTLNVMVGGAHPTFVERQVWAHNATPIVGEAEILVPEILNDISYRNRILKARYIGKNTPVDDILHPSRHLVNLHAYTPGGENTTPVYTSRGCSYDCNFCSKITGSEYRMLPDDNVMEEINQCRDLGFKHIVIGDDNFIINIPRAMRILRRIKDEENIKFRLNQDSRVLYNDIYKLAAEAGCTDISVGIESGSQKILNLMNKRTTVSRNIEMIKLAHEYDLKVKIYLISNFPGETLDTIKETVEFVRKTEPDKCLVSNFAPLPGSDVYNNKWKYGVNWTSPRWSDYYLVGKNGGFEPCFTTSHLTKDNQKLYHGYLLDALKELL